MFDEIAKELEFACGELQRRPVARDLCAPEVDADVPELVAL
jgi:hypothetical protein